MSGLYGATSPRGTELLSALSAAQRCKSGSARGASARLRDLSVVSAAAGATGVHVLLALRADALSRMASAQGDCMVTFLLGCIVFLLWVITTQLGALLGDDDPQRSRAEWIDGKWNGRM